jgi:hypothetical protein
MLVIHREKFPHGFSPKLEYLPFQTPSMKQSALIKRAGMLRESSFLDTALFFDVEGGEPTSVP